MKTTLVNRHRIGLEYRFWCRACPQAHVLMIDAGFKERGYTLRFVKVRRSKTCRGKQVGFVLVPHRFTACEIGCKLCKET